MTDEIRSSWRLYVATCSDFKLITITWLICYILIRIISKSSITETISSKVSTAMFIKKVFGWKYPGVRNGNDYEKCGLV